MDLARDVLQNAGLGSACFGADCWADGQTGLGAMQGVSAPDIGKWARDRRHIETGAREEPGTFGTGIRISHPRGDTMKSVWLVEHGEYSDYQNSRSVPHRLPFRAKKGVVSERCVGQIERCNVGGVP